MKWRKVLYERQNVPDNYVDKSFLDELKRNINVHEYNFCDVVHQTGSITQAVSRVIWLVAVFIELAAGRMQPLVLLSGYMAGLVGCYFIYIFILRNETTFKNILQNCRSLLMVLTFSYVFSPIIKTLTSTISSDTIYCMTFLTMLAHLIVRNYGVVNAPIVSDVLSFNAAIFGATCLSSRLATPLHCFCLIIFAVGLFALTPEFCSVIKESSQFGDTFQTFFHVVVSVVSLWRISSMFTLLYVALILVLTFLCPAVLVAMQPLKNTISGPWDEAVLDEEALNKISKKGTTPSSSPAKQLPSPSATRSKKQ